MKRAIITIDIEYKDNNYNRPDLWVFSELFDLDAEESVSVISIQDNLPLKENNHVS